jgi:hypothetical protein
MNLLTLNFSRPGLGGSDSLSGNVSLVHALTTS